MKIKINADKKDEAEPNIVFPQDRTLINQQNPAFIFTVELQHIAFRFVERTTYIQDWQEKKEHKEEKIIF